MEKQGSSGESHESLRAIIERVENWEHTFVPRTKKFIRSDAGTLEAKIADKITAFVGSMPFVYIHTIWFGVWVTVNLGILAISLVFDPFPFGLLTLIVSLEAIYLSTFVMISQNRQAAIADQRAQLDYEVNVRTEAEVAKLVALVQSIAIHLADRDAQSISGGASN